MLFSAKVHKIPLTTIGFCFIMMEKCFKTDFANHYFTSLRADFLPKRDKNTPLYMFFFLPLQRKQTT